MSTADNQETIRRIYAAMEHGDLGVFAASVHPDYAWRLAGHSSWSKRFEGQEAVRSRLLKPLFALFGTEYRAHAVNLIAAVTTSSQRFAAMFKRSAVDATTTSIALSSGFGMTRSQRSSSTVTQT